MPNAVYVKWLLHVTVPADDHKIVRTLDMSAPDDEVELLNEHIPKLNKDMRVLKVQRFDNPEEYAEAVKAATAENLKQPGYRPFGRFDPQLTQKQADKIKADKADALVNARGRHRMKSATPKTPEDAAKLAAAQEAWVARVAGHAADETKDVAPEAVAVATTADKTPVKHA